MLRYILILFFLLTTLGCQGGLNKSNESDEPNTMMIQQISDADLLPELVLAKQTEDYRLLVTTARKIVVPGIKKSIIKRAIALCGKKYMNNTGDVIRTKDDRNKRKKILHYMQQYNEKMWLLCQSNNALPAFK